MQAVVSATHGIPGVPLPRPSTHGLPDDATIAVPVTEGLVLHRLLEHEAARDRDFEPRLNRSQARLRGVPSCFAEA
jgi:hypothetical protein